MIKIDYEFKALSPIHTGADEDFGTMKTLRRQKILLDSPILIESEFSEEERLRIIVEILEGIYHAIDFSKIKGQRLMGFWDEFYSKLLKAATVQDKYQFLDSLMKSWGIRSFDNVYVDVVDHIDRLSNEELLNTIREKTQYLVLKLRQVIKMQKEGKVLPSFEKGEPSHFVKNFEYIPVISGNSFRGYLRRLAMYDFVKRVGIDKLEKGMYHMLFTGGALNESSSFEDIDKREELISMCPLIGVMGSAIGNMTIMGEWAVGFAYPKCKELGTGEKSYWEYLDTVFQTRHDSSKNEEQIEIVEKNIKVNKKTGEVAKEINQMKYEYEVFAPGTVFTHGFRMRDKHSLLVSAFWHVLTLFKENPFIGGRWAVGNSEIDLSELKIPKRANKEYLSYLEENKEKIRDFFAV